MYRNFCDIMVKAGSVLNSQISYVHEKHVKRSLYLVLHMNCCVVCRVCITSHQFVLTLWATAFYVIENYNDEIKETEFQASILQVNGTTHNTHANDLKLLSRTLCMILTICWSWNSAFIFCYKCRVSSNLENASFTTIGNIFYCTVFQSHVWCASTNTLCQ